MPANTQFINLSFCQHYDENLKYKINANMSPGYSTTNCFYSVNLDNDSCYINAKICDGMEGFKGKIHSSCILKL